MSVKVRWRANASDHDLRSDALRLCRCEPTTLRDYLQGKRSVPYEIRDVSRRWPVSPDHVLGAQEMLSVDRRERDPNLGCLPNIVESDEL